ncbi:MAG: hypothetical protein WCP28_11190, partial [Actinomycetes bacterium]
ASRGVRIWCVIGGTVTVGFQGISKAVGCIPVRQGATSASAVHGRTAVSTVATCPSQLFRRP